MFRFRLTKKIIFIDTAGIRKYKQSNAVEYFSYVRAMHSVDESDIVLMLIDAINGVVDQDLRILNLVGVMVNLLL